MADAPGQRQTQSGQDLDVVLADYESTCEVIKTLVDIRFRLAAFVPILTGAAAALITSNSLALDAMERGFLSAGGLLFVLGISMYDLRNTQHYNSAIGRAEFLEADHLAFPKHHDDAHVGVYGTRNDTTANLKAKKKHRFGFGRTGFGLPIRHATGISMAYGAALGVWVWALGSAIVDGQGWTEGGRWWPIVAAALATTWYILEYRRID